MTGAGRWNSPCITVMSAVFAPIPRAKTPTMIATVSLFRPKYRNAKCRSPRRSSIHRMPRASRASSWSAATFPNSRRAARRASSRDMPRAVSRSMARSRCSRISACMSLSRARRPNTARRRSSARRKRIMGSPSGGLKNGGEGAGKPCPVLALFGELLPARSGERIDLGPATLGRVAPLGLDHAALLEAVERRVERAGVHPEHVRRDGLDAQAQVIAVRGLDAEELEDDELERALQERGWIF